jgi:valine dehydrogenase (NAD+)
MNVTDMDVIAETCPWTTGRSPEKGGVGDSGILTSLGVFRGIQACVEATRGDASLEGLTVGVVGVGKVGGRLAGHLIAAGANVVAFDPSATAREQAQEWAPGIGFVDSLDALLASPMDVLSPNALGGLLTEDVAANLSASIVCGGANNQLATPAVGDLLAQRGITYAPDFLVNCGGVIQVAEELVGGDMDRAREKTERVRDTTLRVLDRARTENVTPVTAAEQEAEDRIARVASERA